MSRLIVSGGFVPSVPYRNFLYIKDDFLAGGTSAATVGELGWAQTNGTAGPYQQVAGHPGVYRIDSSASSGTVAGLSLGPNGAGSLLANELWDMTFVIKATQNDTDTQIRFGIEGSATGDPSANGIFFEKLYADTSWFGVTRSGGSQNRTAALGNVTTSWVTLRMRQLAAGTILFSIDGGAEVSASSTVPAGVSVEPFGQIKNQVASSKTVDIDYFECTIVGLSRT